MRIYGIHWKKLPELGLYGSAAIGGGVAVILVGDKHNGKSTYIFQLSGAFLKGGTDMKTIDKLIIKAKKKCGADRLTIAFIYPSESEQDKWIARGIS